jgi:hypothetical protein
MILTDVAKVEAMEGIGINMASWYRKNGTCTVCAAGAIAICRVGVDMDSLPSRSLGVLDPLFEASPKEWLNAYKAADALRQGEVSIAAYWMGKPVSYDIILDRPVCQYYESPERWRRDMEKLYDALKAVRL